MIADGLQKLADLIFDKSRAGTRLIKDDFNPRSYFLLHNGELTGREVPPKVRQHTVYNLRDLVALASTETSAPSIWHSHQQIRAILEGEYREDCAVLKLTPSHEFNVLAALSGKRYSQAELLTLLRV